MTARALALAVTALAVAAPAAHASYAGTVDASTQTSTLSGSGPLALSTGAGLVHHANIGPGFASNEDFDSSAPGDQTVPDSGGWSVNATGSGADKLGVQEGETLTPVSYAFGHKFFPGGVPCAVRDPNDRGGVIAFSRHPAEETEFCFPGGFKEVAVHAGATATDFAVLDTGPGVTLRAYGSAGDDMLTEAANVPSSVDEFHNPESPVHFYGGKGRDFLTLNDGPVTAPATYTVADGAIRKSGLPPLYFDGGVDGLVLYPQDGPSNISVGRTGGRSLQVFGGFHGQSGPDRIDARFANAPVFVTGSSGADTILGSVFGDYLDGGGGNDSIVSRDASIDQVVCRGGTGPVQADRLDKLTDCPAAKSTAPLIALTRASFAPSKVKHGKRLALDLVGTAAGKVTLGFKGYGTKTVNVKLGPNLLTFKPKLGGRTLAKGKYRVPARLVAKSGKRSKPLVLALTIK
ncbi:MAG TPA: hypothetical protein VGC98_07490 [Thermoleophilaceae bacterium]